MRERIFAIVRKELSQLFRNRRTRMFLFVPPMFQLIIFGYAVNLDVDNLRMGWMDMDQSPQSHDLLADFQGSGRFLLTALPQNEREIQDVLDRGDAQVVVRVLPGFGRDILLGRPAARKSWWMAPIPTPHRWLRPIPANWWPPMRPAWPPRNCSRA